MFEAVADGRLHLTGVGLLASSLRKQNASELIAAASHKTREQIERLLADRRPRPDVATRVTVMPAAEIAPELPVAKYQHALEHVEKSTVAVVPERQAVSRQPEAAIPAPIQMPALRPRVVPLGAGRLS